MLRLLLALLIPAVAATTAAANQRAAQAGEERAKLIAALDRLMLTGEPLHTSHGEGVWLQAAVDRALAANDREVRLLAQRAAAPLLSHVSSPVRSTLDRPVIEVRHPAVLKLSQPVSHTAQIYASLDGGEMFLVGEAPPAGTSRSLALPSAALAPGLHHLRLQARIVYQGTDDVPPPETRNLQELTYALYDPARQGSFDARIFVESPLSVRANRLNASLPEEPFSSWLTGVLSRHSSKPTVDWRGQYCDDRIRESGALPKTRSLCSVGYFEVRGVIGQVWIRTGRVELTDLEVKWLAEAPAFEGLKLLHGSQAEFDDLAELPALLASDPALLPQGDISVAPEDITVSVTDSGGSPHVQIAAVVRNSGGVDLRGVQVLVAATVNGEHGPKELVIVDVPRRGHAEIKRLLPFSAPYGTILVHAMQASEHGPFESFQPDPTPDDAVAFRIVNPTKAPSGYAARIVQDCGGICRGY